MATIDNAIGAAATWAAVVVSAYLTLGVVATFLSGRSGAAGGLAQAALRLYPRIARTGLRTAVAAVVGMGATIGGAAVAEAGGPPSPPAPPIVAPASPPAEPLDWPVDPTHVPVPSSLRPAPVTRPGVIVRPGDCLWRIAARSLGRAATPAATAAAWPMWWAANRTAIGDNPDLLRPGLRLQAPRTHGRSDS
jgi:nucleoid-associated protein YgaU